jgi:predicted metal-binding membrane protein
MSESRPLVAVLKRDRTVVMLGLSGVTALAWVFTVQLFRGMHPMDAGMPAAVPHASWWNGPGVALVFAMWAVMMVGMMVPSAAPYLLAFARVNRRRREERDPILQTALFLWGYVVVWTGFSLFVTLAQWALDSAALMSPMMASTSPVFGGALLLAAGAFQFTPLKNACLEHCRIPRESPPLGWQNRTRGAFLMGLEHGTFCAGSCWVLMLTLFVAGAMSFPWMAVLTGFVLLEKVATGGIWISRTGGGLLMAWGSWMLLGALA